MPTKEIADFGESIGILDLLANTGIVPSKGEARRLIQQNGLSLGEDKVTDPMLAVTKADFEKDGYIIVKKGKKAFFKVVIKG